MLHEFSKKRRSIRVLKQGEVPEKVISGVLEIARQTPSAFNMQSDRVVVLENDKHRRFWDLTLETLKPVMPGDQLPATTEKIQGFKSGHGTILFYQDKPTVERMAKQFSLYADQFSIWAEQSCGIMQYLVWTAFSLEGYGASLQHYNPLIDEQVQQEFKLNPKWVLKAQMPFGLPGETPQDKDFLPTDQVIVRLK